MFTFFLFTTLIGFEFSARGTYEECLPRKFYEDVGITIGDRSQLDDVKFLKVDWDSGLLINDIFSILVRVNVAFFTQNMHS